MPPEGPQTTSEPTAAQMNVDVSRGRFPGWQVVLSVSLLFFTSSGLGFYGLAVYLRAITRERGFSTTAVSGATSVFFVVGGIGGVVVARLITRFDVRRIIAVGSVFGGASLALLGRVTSVWQVYLVYACFGLGWSAGNVVPGITVLTRWFRTKRSVALAWASTGLSVGGLVLTPLATRLIKAHGLARSTPWLGLAFAALIVPNALFLLKPDPAPLGWLPDGAPSLGEPPVVEGFLYRTAIRHRFFICVTGAYLLCMCAQVGGISHMVKLGAERVSDTTGATAVSVLAIGSVIGRLIGGWVAPRVPMTRMTMVLIALQGSACVWLSQAGSRAALLGGAFGLGLTVGNILLLRPLLLAEGFGTRDFPHIASLSELLGTIGIAAGPFLVGFLHDRSDYRLGFRAIGILSLIAVFVLAFAGDPSTVRNS